MKRCNGHCPRPVIRVLKTWSPGLSISRVHTNPQYQVLLLLRSPPTKSHTITGRSKTTICTLPRSKLLLRSTRSLNTAGKCLTQHPLLTTLPVTLTLTLTLLWCLLGDQIHYPVSRLKNQQQAKALILTRESNCDPQTSATAAPTTGSHLCLRRRRLPTAADVEKAAGADQAIDTPEVIRRAAAAATKTSREVEDKSAETEHSYKLLFHLTLLLCESFSLRGLRALDPALCSSRYDLTILLNVSTFASHDLYCTYLHPSLHLFWF